MDQSRVPVLEALMAFRHRGDIVIGPPGHRQGLGVDPRVLTILGEGVFASDVLSLNGLDDRRQSQGVIEQAQELMADAVGAEHAFMSTCGSSLSVKSAMLAVAGPGEELLVSRNAHKSVMAGILLSGAHPVWVHPQLDEERRMTHPPEPGDVRRALEAHPDARGMLLISPTDWGSCADIAGVAEACHDHGVPLIVDEAWGAHFPFHPDLPAWGMDAGADVVVTSVHKMGAAVEQSSVFHLQGDLVDPDVLEQREDLLGTTSASSLVYASLDGWRRHMVEHGEELLQAAITRARGAAEAIDAVDGLRLMGREIVDEGYAADLDPLVLTIDVRDLGITGYQAGDLLRTAHHLDLAAFDACRVSARLTHGDDDARIAALVAGLTDLPRLAADAEHPPPIDFPSADGLQLETVVRPRDAFFGRVEQVPVAQAVGRVAAEMVSPYPPGVPVLAPGEQISQEAIDYLVTGVRAGMLVPDAADPGLSTIRVVA